MLTRDRVYQLCNQYNLFTHGDNTQYERMFVMVENGAKIHDIALIIWICSDPSFNLKAIEGLLKKASELEKLKRLNDRLNGY